MGDDCGGAVDIAQGVLQEHCQFTSPIVNKYPLKMS